MGALRAAPLVAVAAWFALVVAGLAAAALQATEPPVWDALSYVQKAMAFWQAVDAGKPFNPFDLPMTMRPPGTVLMSYPLGWSEDYRWFYFRSCAIPIGLLLLAAFIGGWSRAMTAGGRWLLAALALALAGMPILYQFQSTGDTWPASWGLVDGFLAGVAALAAAAVTRSAAQRSIGWAAAAAVLGAFCFLIKPAGLALMALTGTAWLAMTIQRGTWTQLDDAAERRFALVSTIIALVVFSGAIAAAVTSAYFSDENLAFGRSVMSVFGTGIAGDAEALAVIRKCFGYVVPLLLLGGLIIAARAARGAAIAALLCLFAGLWFWLGQTELGQIRYFLPFAAMAYVLLLPTLVSWLLTRAARTRIMIGTLTVAPAILTAALMQTPAPSPFWQNALGVNLQANAFGPENAQAEDFLRALDAEEVQTTSLYMADTTPTQRAFIAVADYANVARPGQTQVRISSPVDWQNPNATRLEHILAAEFIIFEPPNDDAARDAALARTDVPDFATEIETFSAWLSTLTPADGVDTVSETRVRLLRIADHTAFDAVLARFEQSRRWPPGFYIANPPRWWSAADVALRLKSGGTALADITFHADKSGMPALLLHGALVERAADSLRLDLWVETDAARDTQDWRLFVHLLDAKGDIVGNHERPLAGDTPPDTAKNVRHLGLIIPAPPSGAVSAAFGFLRAQDGAPELMTAARGPTDWDGRRLILPLPASR